MVLLSSTMPAKQSQIIYFFQNNKRKRINSVNQVLSSVDISSNNSNETQRKTRLCTEISSQVKSSASPSSSLSTLFLSSLISPTPTSSTLCSLPPPLPYLAYLEN
ncbi:unnamed protein product [Rotaria magnacalcarata]|uniref:Uncharacterized protein n=1 Tax=Rotaria magnacalcarata TaxID=392030 RepID=A0A816AZH4_9BILA|nr:unnamed protein product [Rotaria magnacalcarata]CAF1601769.1 unnamed protein product [Rotaria magnacalcarata]CAF1923987.1 unnamed protein product [Rotaria magnacalcarata]CAF2116570.1 unnamed protein product [Rotaria magnacalcarata]CAF2224273.1 unnamed protein product [Rotaria magnacalcarata]